MKKFLKDNWKFLLLVLFGYLYRKYNIRYAMISHGLCHIYLRLYLLFKKYNLVLKNN